MKKFIVSLMLIVFAVVILSFTGCGVNEDSYNLVFGNNSKSIIPSVGNGAYENLSTNLEERNNPQPEPDESGSTTTPPPTYVDPTDGFDCADD